MNLINVLIRTSYRPEQFKRCIESVKRQTHPYVRTIVGYDRTEALDYIGEVESVPMKTEEGRFFYNKFCNSLKSLVTEGWFFFLDDDDFLIHPKIKVVRNKGLMMAIEIDNFENVIKVCQLALSKGVFVDWFLFNTNSIRVAPPLIISEDEIKLSCQIIIESLNEVFA